MDVVSDNMDTSMSRLLTELHILKQKLLKLDGGFDSSNNNNNTCYNNAHQSEGLGVRSAKEEAVSTDVYGRRGLPNAKRDGWKESYSKVYHRPVDRMSTSCTKCRYFASGS